MFKLVSHFLLPLSRIDKLVEESNLQPLNCGSKILSARYASSRHKATMSYVKPNIKSEKFTLVFMIF